MTGIEMIAVERAKQLETHSIEDDVREFRNTTTLLMFAFCLMSYGSKSFNALRLQVRFHRWMNEYVKRYRFKGKSLQRLAIAGALIAAEIDKRQRVKELLDSYNNHREESVHAE